MHPPNCYGSWGCCCLYIKQENGSYSADATAPVFEEKTLGDKGTKYYWTTDASKSTSGISVNGYYFTKDGNGTHNMTSGAYASGSVANNLSNDLILATPCFVYNANTRMLYWTVEKLDTNEYALRYFLYLNNSATHVGEDDVLPAGTYPTNHHATVSYTNYLQHNVSKDFPVPCMTWNGAQVSYVFYLVNDAGQPINSAGQVVDFANAVFVTDVFTKNVIWNDSETPKKDGIAYLDANYEAGSLLPEGYTPYDAHASYQLNVYEDVENSALDSQFTIGASEGIANRETTKVYNTKAGHKISIPGTYTKANASDIDFANTTVAFAVVWSAKLVEDEVVVDFGLDTMIDVTRNDLVTASVSGIGTADDVADYGKEMNSGLRTEGKKLTAAVLETDDYKITIENSSTIRFHQKSMRFSEPVTFYYESPVTYYSGSNTQNTGYMYTKVTVIPATTLYYEDSYVVLTTYTSTNTTDENGSTVYDSTPGWVSVSDDNANANAVQAQDRPGESKISADIDADNNYGFDAAYTSMSQYSMGGAAVATVKSGVYATAEFDFWGTGFDIISLTDNTTGTIVVNVYDEAGSQVAATTVDTYYGYTYNAATKEWVLTASDASNALYQVPVIKIGDGKFSNALDYGKYTVKITATYIPFLDHTADEGYNFYLDAIRIYNPTGNLNDEANDAYVKDGEGWPKYFEVKDEIISANDFNSILDAQTVNGVVFIDGGMASPTVADYTSYGPNNEVYLDHGNAIAFDLNAAAVQGTEVAKIQLAVKTVGGTGKVEVYGMDSAGNITPCLSKTISTATDLYYEITALNGKTVVIKNAGDEGDAIVSITTVKVTYTGAQELQQAATAMFSVRRATADAALLSMMEQEAPETTEPEVTEPEVTEPEATEPEATEPEVTEPETTEPETTAPETTKPSAGSVVETVVKVIRKFLGWIFG